MRLLHNLIRTGIVAEVDHEAERARIQTGENLTGWVRWTTSRAADTHEWNPPVIGEQVLLLCPSGDLDQGIILASLTSRTQPPPSRSPDVHRHQYPDGSFAEYNHQTHQLSLTIKGSVQLTVEGNCSATVGGNLQANVTGTTTLTGKKDINVSGPNIKLNDGKGVVTGAHICAYTGAPHSDCSSSVFAGK